MSGLVAAGQVAECAPDDLLTRQGPSIQPCRPTAPRPGLAPLRRKAERPRRCAHDPRAGRQWVRQFHAVDEPGRCGQAQHGARLRCKAGCSGCGRADGLRRRGGAHPTPLPSGPRCGPPPRAPAPPRTTPASVDHAPGPTCAAPRGRPCADRGGRGGELVAYEARDISPSTSTGPSSTRWLPATGTSAPEARPRRPTRGRWAGRADGPAQLVRFGRAPRALRRR